MNRNEDGSLIPEIDVRRSRRAIEETPIDEAVVARIMTAATYAPSCSNKQPWRFIVCTTPDALGKAREALNGGNYWAKKAPVMVIAVTRDEWDCQLNDDRNYALFGLGMAAMNLMLQATREGLYAHPMAGFDPATVRTNFSIAPQTRVVTMIALGYPGDASHLNDKHRESEASERQRKPIDEVVFYNTWSELEA